MCPGGDDDEDELVRELRARGYVVKRRVTYRKHSFEISEALLKDFMDTVKAAKLRVRDAHSEALKDWITKRKKS